MAFSFSRLLRSKKNFTGKLFSHKFLKFEFFGNKLLIFLKSFKCEFNLFSLRQKFCYCLGEITPNFILKWSRAVFRCFWNWNLEKVKVLRPSTSYFSRRALSDASFSSFKDGGMSCRLEFFIKLSCPWWKRQKPWKWRKIQITQKADKISKDLLKTQKISLAKQTKKPKK